MTCTGKMKWFHCFTYHSSIHSDIDECEVGTDNCDSNASCSNTAGSFTCACNQGYSGDGVTCTGKMKWFHCFTYHSSIHTDIDECEVGTDNCDSNASCSNTAGSFTCACNQGYSGDGVTCTGKMKWFHCFTYHSSIHTDIDECEVGTDNCNSNASCTNIPGGFTCACNQGYSGNGVTCTGKMN